jgi:small redox-active disulfide protein 2
MKVQILGKGCSRCVALGDAVQKAAELCGVTCEIEKVTNMAQIASYGVMQTPALVVDGKVKSTGKILTVDQVKEILVEK